MNIENESKENRSFLPHSIAQALQKPYHDLLFGVHRLIIRYNNWHGARPDCPFIQLTTLDENKDAKQVSMN